MPSDEDMGNSEVGHNAIGAGQVYSQGAALVADAIASGARFLWMQIGITNPDAARRAEAAGLLVVQDRCTKTEHRRLQAQRLAL